MATSSGDRGSISVGRPGRRESLALVPKVLNQGIYRGPGNCEEEIHVFFY